jgi:hypothetical protein
MVKAIVSKLGSNGARITVRAEDHVVTFLAAPNADKLNIIGCESPSLGRYNANATNNRLKLTLVKKLAKRLGMDVAATERFSELKAEAKVDPTLYSTRYEVYYCQKVAALHALRQAVAAEPDPTDAHETIDTAAAALAKIEPPTLEEHPWHRSPGAYWGDGKAHESYRTLTERMRITAVYVATGKIL